MSGRLQQKRVFAAEFEKVLGDFLRPVLTAEKEGVGRAKQKRREKFRHKNRSTFAGQPTNSSMTRLLITAALIFMLMVKILILGGRTDK